MVDVTSAGYRQNLIKYLEAHENNVPRIYVDIYGNLTGGMGTKLLNWNGAKANAYMLTNELAGTDLKTAQTVIDLYKPIADAMNKIYKEQGGYSITNKAGFDTHALKAKLSEVFDVAFEPVNGTTGSPYAINIKGIKKTVNGVTTVTPINDFISQGQAINAALTYLKDNTLETKIDTAFGSQSASLTEIQRFSIIDMAYNSWIGQGGSKLQGIADAYSSGNDAAILVQFAKGRMREASLRTRALENFADFTGSQVTVDEAGNSIVAISDFKESSVYKYSSALNEFVQVKTTIDLMTNQATTTTTPVNELVTNPPEITGIINAIFSNDPVTGESVLPGTIIENPLIDRNKIMRLLDNLVNSTDVRVAANDWVDVGSAFALNKEVRGLRDAFMSDPNYNVSLGSSGQIIVNANGNTYMFSENGQLARVSTDAANQPNGMVFITGDSAGKTLSLDAGNGLTALQTADFGNRLINGLVAAGVPLDYGYTLLPDTFNGIMSATLTELGTSRNIADLSFQAVTDNSGNRTGFITTRDDIATGTRTQTVETTINGDAVNMTFTIDATGRQTVHVNSINGQSPIDQAAADAAIQSSGVDAYVVAQGDAGVTGTDVVGIVAANDATQPTGLQTLNHSMSTMLDALRFISAIKSGEPLPIVASGLTLANSVNSTFNQATGSWVPNNKFLSGTSSAANAVMSLVGLESALKRGDAFGAVVAGAQTIGYTASAYSQLTGSMIPGELGSFASGVNTALPYLNIVNSIVHGDPLGAAMGVLALNPATAPIAYAYYAFQIVQSLFGGGDSPPVPEAWGNAQAQWNGTDVVTSAVGGDGGLSVAQGTYDGFLNYLDQLAAQEAQLNPGSAIGVIANRLPSITFRDFSGYTLTDIDPLTGQDRSAGTRYDNTGHPYGAPPGSVQASQSLSERFVRVALERGAIAPMWEVETAAMQTAAGDPQAGLTEEERAGRAGKLAVPPSTGSGGQSNATEQTFRPVALDLNGDGVQTTGAAKTVAFNVDDSGFYKSSSWISNSDAFLFLDRNLNGQIDGGKELFSNATVSLGERGLNGMRWIDSNYDGKITSADPVWNELKVWQDANGNGAADAGETKTLAQLGITELNHSMGTFTMNGQARELSGANLTADTQGTRTFNVPEGIIVETSNGEISLLATRIDDRSVIEANRDGVTGYEDTETIIGAADLLANDALAVTAFIDLIREVGKETANDNREWRAAA